MLRASQILGLRCALLTFPNRLLRAMSAYAEKKAVGTGAEIRLKIASTDSLCVFQVAGLQFVLVGDTLETPVKTNLPKVCKLPAKLVSTNVHGGRTVFIYLFAAYMAQETTESDDGRVSRKSYGAQSIVWVSLVLKHTSTGSIYYVCRWQISTTQNYSTKGNLIKNLQLKLNIQRLKVKVLWHWKGVSFSHHILYLSAVMRCVATQWAEFINKPCLWSFPSGWVPRIMTSKNIYDILYTGLPHLKQLK